MTNQETIDNFILKMTAKGWQVVHVTGSAVQLRRPKRWNRALLIIGLVLLLAAGAGILVFILAAIDYIVQSDKIITVTAEQIKAGTVKIPSTWSMPMMLAAALILIVLACIAFAFLSQYLLI